MQVETFAANREQIAMYVWPNPQARHLVVLAHGYGEHLGRYEYVAEFLTGRGAVVAGPRWGVSISPPRVVWGPGLRGDDTRKSGEEISAAPRRAACAARSRRAPAARAG